MASELDKLKGKTIKTTQLADGKWEARVGQYRYKWSYHTEHKARWMATYAIICGGPIARYFHRDA